MPASSSKLLQSYYHSPMLIPILKVWILFTCLQLYTRVGAISKSLKVALRGYRYCSGFISWKTWKNSLFLVEYRFEMSSVGAKSFIKIDGNADFLRLVNIDPKMDVCSQISFLIQKLLYSKLRLSADSNVYHV